MKRCKHHRILMYRRKGDAWEHTMTLSGVTLMWQRFFECDRAHCGDCGHQMALAPATDTGPHAASVAVEVRAAEIANRWLTQPPDFAPTGLDDEARGWSLAETNMQNHTDAWHAGYLARVIATHTEET